MIEKLISQLVNMHQIIPVVLLRSTTVVVFDNVQMCHLITACNCGAALHLYNNVTTY